MTSSPSLSITARSLSALEMDFSTFTHWIAFGTLSRIFGECRAENNEYDAYDACNVRRDILSAAWALKGTTNQRKRLSPSKHQYTAQPETVAQLPAQLLHRTDLVPFPWLGHVREHS